MNKLLIYIAFDAVIMSVLRTPPHSVVWDAKNSRDQQITKSKRKAVETLDGDYCFFAI